MDWLTNFLQNIVDFTATLDPRMALLLLIICAVGELSLTIPLLLEFIWLNVGMYLGNGQLAFWHMLALWFSAQAGRQIGAVVLYRFGRLVLPALEAFYHKIHLDRIFDRLMAKAPAVNKINLASPFSVAFGRLVGMRIPMTLVLAAKKKPWILAAGVFMASMVFDGLYIFAGAVLGLTIDDVKKFNPLYTVLITVGLMLCIYLFTFIMRLIIKKRRQAHQTVNVGNDDSGDGII
jgi:membrane-associated protein